jgi:hypothetical protein
MFELHTVHPRTHRLQFARMEVFQGHHAGLVLVCDGCDCVHTPVMEDGMQERTEVAAADGAHNACLPCLCVCTHQPVRKHGLQQTASTNAPQHASLRRHLPPDGEQSVRTHTAMEQRDGAGDATNRHHAVCVFAPVLQVATQVHTIIFVQFMNRFARILGRGIQ